MDKSIKDRDNVEKYEFAVMAPYVIHKTNIWIA